MTDNRKKEDNKNMEETISKPEMKENKMGTMPVGKLLMNMSLPIIISMLVQAMYNIIDSIFVAQINGKCTNCSFACIPQYNVL